MPSSTLQLIQASEPKYTYGISSNNITATHTQNRMSSWLNFIVDAVESSIFTDGIRPSLTTTAAAEYFGARITDFTPALRIMQPYQF